MEYKYPNNLRFNIIKTDGVKSTWKFPKAGSVSNDCEQKGRLEIGEEATLKYSRRNNERFKYYLTFDSGLESDYFSDREVEILMGEDFAKLLIQNQEEKTIHIQKLKPTLEVMPKDIYECLRVQELCRALHEYSNVEKIDLELMIKWSDELNDRLYGLKGDMA